MTRLVLGGAVAGAALAGLAAGLPVTARTTPAATAPVRFGAPVRLTTTDNFGGYEPGLLIDRFGNVVVTAHKQNHGDALSPDANGQVPVRSASWVWTSTDGEHFTDMPGLQQAGGYALPTQVQQSNLQFGDEGDLAGDGKNRIYFIDTNVPDVTFARWTASGLGQITFDSARPAVGTAQPVDDRPWVVAHGDGVVAYFGNEGDKTSYPAPYTGPTARPGSGPGRYTVYMSTDGGQTFDHTGYQLPDSGWCRPAADQRPETSFIYAFCTNDSGADDNAHNEGSPGYTDGTLWAYVSADNGQTFTRYRAGSYNGADPTISWPSMAIDRRGWLYALYNDGITTPSSGTTGTTNTLTGNRLHLYQSKDNGRTWTMRDVTPAPGFYHYTWMNVMPDGTVGIAYYYSPKQGADWHVYAGTAPSFGGRFDMTSVAPDAPVATAADGGPLGDFFECAFDPAGRLNVVWTRITSFVAEGTAVSPSRGLNSDIYYTREVSGPSLHGSGVVSASSAGSGGARHAAAPARAVAVRGGQDATGAASAAARGGTPAAATATTELAGAHPAPSGRPLAGAVVLLLGAAALGLRRRRRPRRASATP